MDIARKVLPKGAKNPSTHKHLGIVGNTMTEKSVDTTKTTNIQENISTICIKIFGIMAQYFNVAPKISDRTENLSIFVSINTFKVNITTENLNIMGIINYDIIIHCYNGKMDKACSC